MHSLSQLNAAQPMMFNMQDAPQTETPLDELLPLGVKALLQKNGIHTVEDVRKAYPHTLLKFRGIGMAKFRQIEAAFFPGKKFEPARVLSPLTHVKGSSLNGALSPAIVRILARGGITTVDQLKAAQPADLLKIERLGIGMLREIESVFFPGQHYEVPRGRRPAPTLRDSAGNLLTDI